VDISNALTIYTQEKNTYGYLVLIDELHHNPNVGAVFEFLKLSQGLTQYLFDYHNIGFFIAGHTSWTERLENPTYSGPISHYELMDEIDSNQSYMIVNKRIAEFSINKHDKNKIFVEKDAIEKIYTFLSPITPRQLLEDTGEAFEKLPETKMSLSAMDISHKVDARTISAIKKKITGMPLIHRKLRNVITNYKNIDEKKNAFRALSKLYEKGSIDIDINQDNLIEFGLKDMQIFLDLQLWGLINKEQIKTKQKGQYGSITLSETVYKLDKILINIFDTIVSSYKLYPEDFLERIYMPEIFKIQELKTGKKELYVSEIDEHLHNIKNILIKNKYNLGSK